MARGGYRPGSGPAKGTKYKQRVPKKIGSSDKKTKNKAEKKSKIPDDIKNEASAKKLEPLDYMLEIMNDPSAGKERRDRMAVAAAPFCHARKGEGAGKKQEKDDKAKAASSGKFAAAQSPLRVVK
jgi:phage terminase small subunit